MSSILGYSIPAGEPATNTTAATSAEIVLGTNAIFEVTINGTAPSYIKFGNAGMTAATTADILLPANYTTYWETSSAFDRVRVLAGAATIVSVQKLSRV